MVQLQHPFWVVVVQLQHPFWVVDFVQSMDCHSLGLGFAALQIFLQHSRFFAESIYTVLYPTLDICKLQIFCNVANILQHHRYLIA